MTNEKTTSVWVKWVVGSLIAAISAGGGLVAVLNYVDDRSDEANKAYREAMAEWEAFSPESIASKPQVVEISAGKCLDLDRGRLVEMISRDWELCFHWYRDDSRIGLSIGNNVQVVEFGVAEFAQIDYRSLRDAAFTEAPTIYRDLPMLFRQHKNDAPRAGYTYFLKLPTRRVAKVQIVRYGESRLMENADLMWPYVQLRYEVFPIVPDPPRPRRP